MERLKDSEIYAHKYAQLTFYKGAKPNEEGQHFQQTVLKQLDIQRQRGKKKKPQLLGLSLRLNTKTNSK